MPASFRYDVFLSYNSQDKVRVRKLADRLADAGLQVWFDDWMIKPGDDVFLAIERGLEATRVQVLCLSPAAIESEWVTLERNTVLFRDPTNAGRRFVPLMLTACRPPDTLRRYKYLDFRQETPEAFGELLAACIETEEVPSLSDSAAVVIAPQPDRGSQPQERLAVLDQEVMGHGAWINDVAVSSNGGVMVSASNDKTLKIWNLRTLECSGELAGHTDVAKSVAFVPHGSLVLSASFDKTVRVWNTETLKEQMSLVGHRGKVLSVVASKDGRHAISGGFDKTIRVWDLHSGDCVRTILCGTDDTADVFSTALNPQGTHVWSGHRDGRLRLWNLKTGICETTLKGHSDALNAIRLTDDGVYALSGSSDRTIKVWNIGAETCVGTLEGHEHVVQSLAISPVGLVASTGFLDKTVRLWDWKSGACLQSLSRGQFWSPTTVAFSPSGDFLVVATAAASIARYRLSNARTFLATTPVRRYVNAKVVLLGEGTVGKTSLAHRLVEDKYVVKDRTHGMNVWPLELPLPADATIDREALLWDLAGQEDYRLIHRLFLNDTALALLLINPQKDDPFAEAGDWLKALETAAGNEATQREAARLLVFSQVDVGGMKVGNSKIARFIQAHGFADWVATSAKSGENCSDQASGGKTSRLKQLIAENIPWDRLPWTATPRMLAGLKSAVLTMRSGADIRLLRFAELMQRLEQGLPGQKFGESEVRTAVTLLANQGLARPLKFGDLVLLQPELLNGYAGSIIRAARAHRDEIGSVLEADIYRGDFDFTGVDRLPRADEELLLRAMVQTFLDHSLCIAEETQLGRQLVFPSQYRREKDIPWEPDVFVSYTFGGEWQTIWTTLVVRLWYSQEFEHRELWRNAAQFASARGHLLGLRIDNRQGEGEATISVFFDVKTPDDLKVIFIEYVHRHLARYGCNVERDRRYVCGECGTPVRDVAAVRARLAASRTFITCQACDEQVPLIDFIEQRLNSDPVAWKILAMEEMATRHLDAQALEQILIGHVQAITGEANQIFRMLTPFDYGIDGEIEFKGNDGRASGRKVYVQLKSGNSYLRTRRRDGREVFDVKEARHLEYWVTQPVDVYLVIRQIDDKTGNQVIRWMNVTRYLKSRKDTENRQIVFEGEELTMESVWRLRDAFFPARARKHREQKAGA
ncbi:MAG TPA: TIR domain-containing protein [Gemmatimonadaceae bacterium]|jgi:WD40 repeat protein|nr:TIR domain-containing protein [Gemmatimonadaceae bacterium]